MGDTTSRPVSPRLDQAGDANLAGELGLPPGLEPAGEAYSGPEATVRQQLGALPLDKFLTVVWDELDSRLEASSLLFEKMRGLKRADSPVGPCCHPVIPRSSPRHPPVESHLASLFPGWRNWAMPHGLKHNGQGVREASITPLDDMAGRVIGAKCLIFVFCTLVLEAFLTWATRGSLWSCMAVFPELGPRSPCGHACALCPSSVLRTVARLC